jgi:hypothetical protein
LTRRTECYLIVSLLPPFHPELSCIPENAGLFDEISYSQDATVAAFRDYYSFLAKMYLAESTIIDPPAGGWPTLTTDLQDLGKTDEVISLLAHLPYIRDSGNDATDAQAVPWGQFADWRQLGDWIGHGMSNSQDVKELSEGFPSEDVPPHVVGLTLGSEDLRPFLLLDTELGIVHWYECPGEIKDNPSQEPVEDDAYGYAAENEAEWRAEGESWAIADFFEVLKDQFRELHFVPTSSLKVADDYTTLHGRDGMVPMLKDIYREHRWPNIEQYRKQDCLEAVHKALEEKKS